MLCHKIRLTVCDNKYYDRLMSESLLWGKLLHSLFASLLSFALSSKIQPKVCYREEFNRSMQRCMDKICLKPDTVEEFATDVLWPSVLRDLSHYVATVFWIAWMKPTVCVRHPEKKPFQQTGSILHTYLSATIASLSSLYALLTSALCRSVDILSISKIHS